MKRGAVGLCSLKSDQIRFLLCWRSIDSSAMISKYPMSQSHVIALPHKNLAVLDISRVTTGEIGPQSRLLCRPSRK